MRSMTSEAAIHSQDRTARSLTQQGLQRQAQGGEFEGVRIPMRIIEAWRIMAEVGSIRRSHDYEWPKLKRTSTGGTCVHE